MRVLHIAHVSFFLCLFAGCSGRNLYPDAKSDPNVLRREWTRQTQVTWNAGDKGAETSGAAIYENTLVFGSSSGGLVSIYPGIDQVRWRLPLENGIAGEILVHETSVYFGAQNGFVYSVNAETGEVNWKYETRVPLVSRPTVSAGRVFFTSADDTVYALDAASGEWIWHFKRKGSPTATIRAASAPLVDAGEVLVGLSDGYVVALSVQDGSLRWQRKLHAGRKFTDVDAEPVLSDGVIYLPSYDGSLYALRRKDGDPIWKTESGGAKKVLLDDKKLYFPSSDGSVYCLNRSDSKEIWKFELDGGVPTRVVQAGNWILFGSTHRYFYVLEASTGKLIYRYDVGYGSGFYGSPVLDEKRHRLYVLSGRGNLMSFTVGMGGRR